MNSVDLIIEGSSYNLSDGTLCWFRSHDGLGGAPLHRLAQRGPMQHGDSDLGFRLDPRIFNLAFYIQAPTITALWDRRNTLLSYLRPLDDAITVQFTLDNGDVRRIDCHATSLPMSYDVASVPLLQNTIVQFKAPDPALYDPTSLVEPFYLSAGAGAFVVPMTVPTGVGTSNLNTNKTIFYAGTWIEYPIVTIEGPVTSCVITNVTTDEKLDFTGISIAQGDYYTIDCGYGQKTVKDAGGTNKIAELTNDSDLATFHLDALVGGESSHANSFLVTGTGANSLTEIRLQYKLRFIGI